MKELPQKYNHKEAEKKWQKSWEENKVHAWDESQPRENTFVIDTPPPTVSGVLHMGHIFSYTQADYVARYQRMSGKTVFYPMGFDDNGLPTERLVEKSKKIVAHKMSREEFIKECESVSEEARAEFRRLFESVALSVDWAQEYHTISEESRKISQMSFLDLYNKDEAYRKLQPMLWDTIDQTAIAQAEVVDRELDSFENYLTFGLDDGSGERVGEFQIMTTRPELVAACVAIMCDPKQYHKYEGMKAIRPISGMRVPIIPDDKVDSEKGTGMVMCCTFGDETDIYWYDKYKEEYNLPFREILNRYGKLDAEKMDFALGDNPNKKAIIDLLAGLTIKKARNEVFIKALEEDGSLVSREPIVHTVKCAERSGAPLEYITTQQWFIKVLDKKDALKAKANECNWYPEYMKVRIEQWIDGLNWDWCISRQRYFGVPFPVWYAIPIEGGDKPATVVAEPNQLPVNPLVDTPDHKFTNINRLEKNTWVGEATEDIKDSEGYVRVRKGTKAKIFSEADVMDTWATSSVSPQLSSKGINRYYRSPLEGEHASHKTSGGGNTAGDSTPHDSASRINVLASSTPPQGGSDNPFILNAERHAKLFPADLRPQAHEIIRTWAFYTIVKALLHGDEIPWKNLMISGWCLASDKTKMSKSKGNVVTPVDLIEEQGADVVRYWSSTSKLGTDTAFSEDVLKIGKKLVNKIWNATKFGAIHLQNIPPSSLPPHAGGEGGGISSDRAITETLDKWIITRLHRAIEKATAEFEKFEYSNARAAVEDFFWNDFCDNYLEMIKKRAYNEDGKNTQGQMSAIHTVYHCLEAVLRLFAPITPHVTEELYSHIFDKRHSEIGSIHSSGTWPKAEDYPIDEEAEKAGIHAKQILDMVRELKSRSQVSLKREVEVLLINSSNEDIKKYIESSLDDLKNVTNSKKIVWDEELPLNAVVSEKDEELRVAIILTPESDVA